MRLFSRRPSVTGGRRCRPFPHTRRCSASIRPPHLPCPQPTAAFTAVGRRSAWTPHHPHCSPSRTASLSARQERCVDASTEQTATSRPPLTPSLSHPSSSRLSPLRTRHVHLHVPHQPAGRLHPQGGPLPDPLRRRQGAEPAHRRGGPEVGRRQRRPAGGAPRDVELPLRQLLVRPLQRGPPLPHHPHHPSVFSIPSTLVPTTSPTSLALSSLASRYGVWLIAGSIPERDPDDGRLYNSSLVLNPDGHFVAKHRKVHLFDIDVPGQMTFRESDTLTGGSSYTTFDSPYGRMRGRHLLRHPLPRVRTWPHRRCGCGLLVYPGAFNTTTGPAALGAAGAGRGRWTVRASCWCARLRGTRTVDVSGVGALVGHQPVGEGAGDDGACGGRWSCASWQLDEVAAVQTENPHREAEAASTCYHPHSNG